MLCVGADWRYSEKVNGSASKVAYSGYYRVLIL